MAGTSAFIQRTCYVKSALYRQSLAKLVRVLFYLIFSDNSDLCELEDANLPSIPKLLLNKTMQSENISWRIGGPQGSGVDKAAALFSWACALHGRQIYGHREYHSNIIGRHSYSDVTIANRTVGYHQSPYFLISFEAETLCRHINTVGSGGIVLYNTDEHNKALDKLPFLNHSLRVELDRQLRAAGQGTGADATVIGMLALAERRGVQLLGLPFKALLSELAESLAIKPRAAIRMLNTLATAVSAAVLKLPADTLNTALERVFSGRDKLVAWNLEAVALAYRYVANNSMPHTDFSLEEPLSRKGEYLLLNGTQAVALGKLAGGMGLQSYYPISPATDESTFLEEHPELPLREGGAVNPLLVQVEDELAAISMACGAALTGARSATATSGPGFSLMAESLGWAGMNEVPVVVTLYQRGGPSTGMPTRTDQSDLQFSIHAGHGEFPRMVIASGDIEESFHDAASAFNYAERYQLPVIHLLDKALTSAFQSVPLFNTDNLIIERGVRYESDDETRGSTQRFKLTHSGISPRPLLGQHGGRHWLTGVEHNPEGQVSEDPQMREWMMEKRARKLELALAEIPLAEQFTVYGDNEAPFTIVSWGSNKGALLAALNHLQNNGVAVRVVQLRLLWPFPATALSEVLAPAAPLVVVEGNYSGQLNQLLREQVGRGADHLIVKYSGRSIAADTLTKVLQEIANGKGEVRHVLRDPYE